MITTLHRDHLRVQGIELLGGAPNGLNFEIEYEDALCNYREAIFAVRFDLATMPIRNAKQTATGLEFYIGPEKHEIRLPGGLAILHEFRRPTVLGGENLSHHFQENA